MEKTTELETKYQKLATEYSKIRSHATVLKKAVLDEQAKILELKEVIKEQEQKIRKHDQEMDSLTFRNEQLTKRIAVLQQELQINNRGKKSKSKSGENPQTNFSVLDEELHKKIVENAELVSTLADTQLELTNYKEKIDLLEKRVEKLQEEILDLNNKHKEETSIINKHNKDINSQKSCDMTHTEKKNNEQECNICEKTDDVQKELSYWKQESERWRTECKLLRSKPESNEQLSQYYESQIETIFMTKQLALSEANTLAAENESLSRRLENLILEKNALESILEKSNEELHTTNENYKSQLDAMTEHLAAQNEKLTKQCDEIQLLKHKLSMKK